MPPSWVWLEGQTQAEARTGSERSRLSALVPLPAPQEGAWASLLEARQTLRENPITTSAVSVSANIGTGLTRPELPRVNP